MDTVQVFAEGMRSEFLDPPVVVAAPGADGVRFTPVEIQSRVVSHRSMCANMAGQQELSVGITLVVRSLALVIHRQFFRQAP